MFVEAEGNDTNTNKQPEAVQLEDLNSELPKGRLIEENTRLKNGSKHMGNIRQRPNQMKQPPTWLEEYEL